MYVIYMDINITLDNVSHAIILGRLRLFIHRCNHACDNRIEHTYLLCHRSDDDDDDYINDDNDDDGDDDGDNDNDDDYINDDNDDNDDNDNNNDV
jgi:hypothetical protein